MKLSVGHRVKKGAPGSNMPSSSLSSGHGPANGIWGCPIKPDLGIARARTHGCGVGLVAYNTEYFFLSCKIIRVQAKGTRSEVAGSHTHTLEPTPRLVRPVPPGGAAAFLAGYRATACRGAFPPCSFGQPGTGCSHDFLNGILNPGPSAPSAPCLRLTSLSARLAPSPLSDWSACTFKSSYVKSSRLQQNTAKGSVETGEN